MTLNKLESHLIPVLGQEFRTPELWPTPLILIHDVGNPPPWEISSMTAFVSLRFKSCH